MTQTISEIPGNVREEVRISGEVQFIYGYPSKLLIFENSESGKHEISVVMSPPYDRSYVLSTTDSYDEASTEYEKIRESLELGARVVILGPDVARLETLEEKAETL